jgi:hypothetical protein
MTKKITILILAIAVAIPQLVFACSYITDPADPYYLDNCSVQLRELRLRNMESQIKELKSENEILGQKVGTLELKESQSKPDNTEQQLANITVNKRITDVEKRVGLIEKTIDFISKNVMDALNTTIGLLKKLIK